MKKKFPDYYVGLDIGTSSIGWAVTDRKYNIKKFNGRSMWGIRLFDEAETAESRRLHRSERRRNDRRKWRIGLLQDIFADSVASADPKFFLRMKESRYWPEDKYESGYQKNCLFNDDDYDDRAYNSEYPTIYHLRKALIEGDESALKDPRKVYLACHHIIKNRGHFLFSGDFNALNGSISDELDELGRMIEDEYGVTFTCTDKDAFQNLLKDSKATVTIKKKVFKSLFTDGNTDKYSKAIQTGFAEMLAGAKKSLKALLDLKDVENDKSMSFKNSDMDDNAGEYEALCGERFGILLKLKSIYDWGVLQHILNGNEYISFAKVQAYDKHKSDLLILKEYIRKNCTKKDYYEMFRYSNVKGNYCAYIGSATVNGKKISVKKCSYEDITKRIKKLLSKENDDTGSMILEELESGAFLPKLVTKDNGVIPYQVNKSELIKILENASRYHDFLKEEDKYGTTADKIVSLLTFRIPYYVGPLNTSNSECGFSWAEKRSNEKIRPWNYSEVIDEEKSAENFIRRMTSKCSYLPWANVLPKSSIMYQTYMVLNELNNLRINDVKLSTDMKQDLFENLYKCQKNVTLRQVEAYLKSNKYIDGNETCSFSGVDGPLKASMSSYSVLTSVLGDNPDVTEYIMERIIFYSTIFGDEKKMLGKKIKMDFGDILSDKEIGRLKSLNFSGWGNFSKEFLTDITDINPETGEYECILKALYNRQDNLMQLLSNEYGYSRKIEDVNRERAGASDGIIKYSDVNDIYASPAVKRAVWQAILILKELKNITGKDPAKIFIEMARGSNGKGRTVSRKDQLKSIYKTIKKDIRDWEAEDVVEKLDKQTEEDLRRNKLYLWYTQLGKCMYTGKTITLEDLLYNNNRYDIDHIYPQSKIDDDSIMNNKVLVMKNINAHKSNEYPIDKKYRTDQYDFWKMLNKNKLITDEKFRRLIRNTELTSAEMTDFVARQLVETTQSTKIVGQLIGRYFDSRTVYVKAKNVTAFRKGVDDTVYGYKDANNEEQERIRSYISKRQEENRFIKCRSVNDYHHAKDAYLNIVVGNVYDTRYTSDPLNFIRKRISENKFNSHSIRAIYKFKTERNGIIAWSPSSKDNEGTMATVKKYMQKNDIQFTRYAIENKHGQNGGFYDQNIVKAKAGLRPIKASDKRLLKTERYGGYTTVTPAYYLLVQYKDKKDRVVKRIETLPLYLKRRFETEEVCRAEVLESFAEKNNLKEPKLIINRIKIGSLVDFNGFKMHLIGNNEKQLLFRNANQLVLKDKFVSYIKKLEKFEKRYEKNKDASITEFDGIDKDSNEELYKLFIYKLEKTVYKEKLGAQVNTLNKLRDKFEESSLEIQSVVLLEILNIFRCVSDGADMHLVGGAKEAGQKITLSKNISDKLVIINQSITGLFENRIVI